MSVVGNGNIDVGNKSPTSKPGPSKIPGSGIPDAKISGAMSQQCGDNSNVSAPQKFVRLVGYRDPKARPEPWVRPPRAPRG
jgi:hypothetical protein